MQISENMKIIDLALYLEDHNALVISDVHLGYEEAMNKTGVLIPRFQYKDTIERLQKILAHFKGKKLKEIIIKMIPSTTANNGKISSATAQGYRNTISTSKTRKTRA